MAEVGGERFSIDSCGDQHACECVLPFVQADRRPSGGATRRRGPARCTNVPGWSPVVAFERAGRSRPPESAQPRCSGLEGNELANGSLARASFEAHYEPDLESLR